MWCAIFVSGTRGHEFSGAVKINFFFCQLRHFKYADGNVTKLSDSIVLLWQHNDTFSNNNMQKWCKQAASIFTPNF